MKRVVAVAAALVLAGLDARGQEPAAPPTFAQGVEVVKVDVVVTDKAGNPVADLTRADFTVLDEGKRRDIASFDVIALPEARPPRPAEGPVARPRVATNAEGPRAPGRTFVIVFDNVHMSPLNAQRAKAAALSFLEKGVRDGDRVSLVATAGGVWWNTRIPGGWSDLLAILKGLDGRRIPEASHDHISDYEAMRIYLYQDTRVGRQVQRRFETYGVRSRSEMEAMDARRDSVVAPRNSPYVEARAAETYLKVRTRSRTTLGAVERALEPLARSADRKALLLLSEGFVHDASENGYRQVVEAARRANAALYFIDTRGLGDLPSMYSAEFGGLIPERDFGSVLAETGMDSEGAFDLARDTGGFSVRSTSDLAAGVERIGRESSRYYLLSYDPPSTPADGRFRRIEVRVARPNVVVRARRGYYSPLPPDAAARSAAADRGKDRDLQLALDSPLFEDALPIRMATYVLGDGTSANARVLVAADVDVSWLAPAEGAEPRPVTLDTLSVVGYRDTGEFTRNDQKAELLLKPAATRSGPLWYSLVREFELPPGGYQAKLVVREPSTGRLGSVAADLDVIPFDRLRFSTPVLTDAVQTGTGGGAPSPVLLARRSFRSDRPLFCRFDVLGAKLSPRNQMPYVKAGHVLRRADGGVFGRAEPAEIEPTSLGALSRLMQISLADLPPGPYELVLRAQDEVSGAMLETVEPFTVENPPGR
jgi:VWFA-related protein